MFAALLLAGFSPRAAEAASTPDTWITTKLKIDLLTTDDVSGKAVHVDTIDGKVTLHGTVNSAAEKQKAESVAKKIKGVREVRNLLQVVPESKEEMVEEADENIEKKVADLLKADPSLKDSDIKVKSVNKGMVLLSGKAKTMFDYLRAVESARSVPGVRRVASQITSPDDLPNIDKTSFADGKKNSAQDTWITTATKMRLLADPEVPALAINVDTHQGVVTLFGMVPTPAAKAAAVAQAKKVDAVVGVKDELQVVPEAKQEIVEAKDDAIEHDIETAFKNRGDMKNIQVRVENGVVHLTGNVGSGWRRLQAATIARATKGVRSVQDDLHIEPRG